MAKKYISLFLVGLFVLHLAGFYIYFMVRLGEARVTMRQQLATLHSEQLDKVTLPIQEFQSSWWVNREMEWRGEMYDIAKIERHGNWITIFCLRDKKEKEVMAFISNVVKMGSSNRTQTPYSVVQFFTLKFVTTGWTFAISADPLLVVHRSHHSRSSLPADLLPATPPPRG